MKWLILFSGLLAILPFSAWMRQNPRQMPKIWILMGILPFALEPLHLYMAIVAWPLWPGFVKGVEITAIDLIALAIYLSLPRSRNPLPFRVAMGAYFLAVFLSVFQASVPQAALFYPFQLSRMFLVFAVTSRACADERVAPSLLKGMAIGIVIEAFVVIGQRFMFGQFQSAGTFAHQNTLGLVSHFVVFPFFALLLARIRGWAPPTVPIAGIIIALLTVSRATLGLGGVGYVIAFVLSAVGRWTRRKGLLALVGVISFGVLAPLALSSLNTRFSTGPISEDYDERGAFESAAAAILSDHPIGIGANNYVVIANTRGYNERAGVAYNEGSSSAHVHNVYRLVAAETGYFGLITFLFLLLQPLLVAFLWGWRYRRDVRGDLLLGLGLSLVIVYMHSFFEWIFLSYDVQYFFAMILGLIVGLAQQLGYRRPPRRISSLA